MYKILSLFANVGIAEASLDRKKYKTVLYNELLDERARFYNFLYPDVEQIIGDITSNKIKNQIIKRAQELKVDIIMATPPCQGFSVAGKREKDDPRNKLIFHAMDIIKAVNPKYILIENVIQYFKDKVKYKDMDIVIPDVIKDTFKKQYNFEKKILDSKDFGVPQARKRGFILLSRKDVKKWDFPQKEQKIITVRDAISHLPSIEAIVKGENGRSDTGLYAHNRPTHNLRQITAMKHTPSGKTAHDNPIHFPKTHDGKKVKGFSTTYKRMDWDKPAPTITMMNGSISSQNNVHPGSKKKDGTYSDARVLTLREIFILFSLPEEWQYPQWASDNLVRRVIGEGIPPLLVKKIFEKL